MNYHSNMEKLYKINPDKLIEEIGAALDIVMEMQLKACDIADVERATKVIEKTFTIVKALDNSCRLAAILRHKEQLIKRLQSENLAMMNEINRLKEL